MNIIGRQVPRSNSGNNTDSFIDAPSTASKLLRSSPSRSLGSRTNWNMRSLDAMPSKFTTRSTSLNGSPSITGSRSSSLRKIGDVKSSSIHYTPSLIDLQSFDTELLSPEMLVPNQNDQNNDSKSPREDTIQCLPGDKERANNVAKIKVVVRKRPLNKKEIAKKERDIITAQSKSKSLTVHETKLKVDLTEYVEKHEFVFDAVLNEDVSNDDVYSETVAPIVPLIFQRTKATCFAYGQTGSGKTYTMQPLPLKASQDILRLMQQTYSNQGFHLFVSFFEIYGGKLFDLLNDRKKLFMREDGKQQVCIVGLQEYRVLDVGTIKKFIEKGNAARSTGITGANEESSRSHAILQLAIKKSTNGSESKPARLVGKLSFIDLAGSERGADTTDNDKQTRIEGAEINKSLLALKECIRALDNDQGHIPFRGSKLTEVLRDSFVGNSRTVMVSCISPSSGSCEHTLNTLRYADRVKSLSKGNNLKKDMTSSSLDVGGSSALPLFSPSQSDPFEDNMSNMFEEKNKFRLSKPFETGTSPPSNTQRFPSKSVDSNSTALPYSKNFVSHRGGKKDLSQDEFSSSEETSKQEKPSLKNNKTTETNKTSIPEDKGRRDTQSKQRNSPKVEAKNSELGDDLNALLKEEEDLVNAHRKQLEETIDIVKEEMDLLVEADQPGNQLEHYVNKLNVILSQKAAGIQQLQSRLTNFQRRLNDHNVLISSIN